MRKLTAFLLLIICSNLIHAQQNKKFTGNKLQVLSSVDKHEKELVQLSDQIWGFAETALLEKRSSAALSDYAQANGFRVTKGVAGLPTAFIAEYGSGKPIIGIMGEFDALPGMSQKAIDQPEALEKGAAGHACGHNMFGAASLGAALSIKELIAAGKLKGTIRFYGTPAEEDVGGKIYMAREGLFNDLDVCLDWHPEGDTKSNMQSSQAMVSYMVEFHGKSAHAAADPWDGRSALDGAELFTTGVNFLREHVKPTVRMHYVYKKAGEVPNVVPAEASVWLWIRDSKRSGVAEVEERVEQIAKGAGLMAGVKAEMILQNGDYEQLVNEAGAKDLQDNLDMLDTIAYTAEEIDFAKKAMKNYGLEYEGMRGKPFPLEKTDPDPVGGSTDVADISWIVPEFGLTVTTAPYNAPWHSWIVVACGGMSIGHKGMLFATRALGTTMVDLFENEKLRDEIKKEFLARKGNTVWKAMLPDGPPPLPKD